MQACVETHKYKFVNQNKRPINFKIFLYIMYGAETKIVKNLHFKSVKYS